MTVFSIDVEVYNTHVEFTFASREELLMLAEAILKSRGLKRDPKNISYLIEYIMNKIVFSELE